MSVPNRNSKRPPVSTTITHSQFTSGPIPTADELQKLEAVKPGLAERVVAMAELEQKSRISQNDDIIKLQGEMAKKEYSIPRRGQALGFMSVCLIVGLCAYMVYQGNASDAKSVAIGTIVSLAAVFVLGRRKSNNTNKDNPKG